MQDPVTWQDVWLAGLGAALLGGIAAAFVARLTVWWTQQGDKRAAQLAESRRAAEAITRAAAATFGAIGQAGQVGHDDWPKTEEAVEAWHREWLTQSPVLADESLAGRVQEMSADWTEYVMWLRKQDLRYWYRRDDTTGEVVPEDGMVDELTAYKQILGERYKWVGRSLAAHRRGNHLPAVEQLPDLPDSFPGGRARAVRPEHRVTSEQPKARPSVRPEDLVAHVTRCPPRE